MACKNVSKIPNGLYEINRKLYLVSFMIELEEARAGGNGDNSGDDDNKGDDVEADDLGGEKDTMSLENRVHDASKKTPTHQHINTKNIGYKTISSNISQSEGGDCVGMVD